MGAERELTRDAAGVDPHTTVAADQQLLIALRARDTAAFAELYDRYASYIFGIAMHAFGDLAAAESATMEAFLAVWRSPPAIDIPRTSLRAYLTRRVVALACLHRQT